jgi:hypothetical protein
VGAVRAAGFNISLIIIGDEPPLMDSWTIQRRNQQYAGLRQALNGMGLVGVNLCFDWYPWGITEGGGGNWLNHFAQHGWPDEDCLCHHAGYGAMPDEAMTRINKFSAAWMAAHGWPDVPVLLTLQGFNLPATARPFLEGRLRRIYRIDGSVQLDERIHDRLKWISVYAWAPTPDCSNTVKDFPEVLTVLTDLTKNNLRIGD